MKKILKFRTKIEAVVAVSIIIMVSIGSVFAVRTITDTSDTISTMITNSKGNSWAATGANLRLAYYDLNGTGGKVFVPPGTFYISPNIKLLDDRQLIGSGSTTILKAGSGCVIGVLSAYSADTVSNVTVSDLMIDGNQTIDGINCYGACNVTIKDVTIRRARGTGIHFQEASTFRNCSNMIISNVRIYNTSLYQPIGIAQTHDAVLNNIIIINGSSAGSQGIDLARYCRNISVNNVFIKDCAGGIKCTGLSSTYPNRFITFTNINIDRSRTASGMRIGNSQYVTINNVNIQSTLTENGMTIGVVGEPSKFIDVNNVNINMTGGTGFVIATSTSNVNVNNVIVRGSTNKNLYIVSANNISINNFRSVSALSYNYILTSKYIKISNSDFSGGNSYGLDFESSSFFKVIGCTFKNNDPDGITTELGTCHNYTISDSDFSGNVEKAIDCGAADKYVNVHDNTCKLTDEIDMNNGGTNTTTRFFHDNICVYMT